MPPVYPDAAPRKRRRKLKFVVTGAILLALIIGGAVRHNHAKKAAAAIAVTLEKAAVRSITQVVTATGKIQPEVEVKISPEVYGEIVELPFREGARVRKGQLIVRIKPDLYQAQVDQQVAAVASARGAAATSAAKLEKAQADLVQYEDLHRRKLVSDADYTLYKTNCDAAKADLISALANVDQAEGLLSQARDTLSKTVIYAPMNGTVSSRSSEVGERVVATGSFAGTEIMRVADLSTMEVQVDVNENDIPNVKLGDPVVISIDAYPDRKFNGVVKEIASSAENASAMTTGSGSAAQATGTSTNEVTNFEVKIRVSDRDAQLKPGMSATADIQTQTVANVVAVPIQSVTVRSAAGLTSEQLQDNRAKDASSAQTPGSASARKEARLEMGQLKRVVFVRDGSKVRMRDVETGIADDSYIEIKSGVAAGEQIVSGSYSAISHTLKDGSEVRVEAEKQASLD